MKFKTKCYCFDLDNVICTTNKNYYQKSKPKKNVIKKINSLYEIGHKIIIFTARGMTTYKENKNLINKNLRPLTKNQLKCWGLKYHKLIMCKPSYDVYIDDKNFSYQKDWYKKI